MMSQNKFDTSTRKKYKVQSWAETDNCQSDGSYTSLNEKY